MSKASDQAAYFGSASAAAEQASKGVRRQRASYIRKLKRLIREVINLSHIMPTRDALRLILADEKLNELEVHLKGPGRKVVLRSGTSDTACLKQVFIAKEYKTPSGLDPKVIVDAGANIGMATLFFAHEYPQAKIVAIEPEASNFALLQRNCAGLPNVIPIHAALWATEQPLVIEDSSADKWAFSVAENKDRNDLQSVRAITIPGLLNQLGVPRIDILKLDIEGAEKELFGSEAGKWLGAVGMIIIELHDYRVAGCAKAFYSRIAERPFAQTIRGENIVINFSVSPEQ